MNEKHYRYYKGDRDKLFTKGNGTNYYSCQHDHQKKRDNGNTFSPINKNSFHPVFNPAITINISANEQPTKSIELETFQYIALAEEDKRTYTNQDALNQYSSTNIPHPENISYMNLFINGVLQPDVLYTVTEGLLTLRSSDLPLKDTPIILLVVIAHV